MALGIGTGRGAEAAPLDADTAAVVERHLAVHVSAAPRVEIPAGDARFIVHRVELPPGLRGLDARAVEARVTRVAAPRGVVVHGWADRMQIEGGVATWVVLIHVEPGLQPGLGAGGDVRYDLNFIERRGLGNSLHRQTVTTQVDVVAPTFTEQGLARDFAGYRQHRARALRAAERMRAIRYELRFEDQGPIPPTGRLKERGLAIVQAFLQSRHRAFVAERRLDQARRFGTGEVRELAAVYWQNRDRRDDALADVPNIPLVAPPGPETSQPTEEGVLAPIATYTPGTDRPEPSTGASGSVDPAHGGASTDGAQRERASEPVTEATGSPRTEPDAELRAPAERAPSKTWPAHRRPLTLDDPNIAFGGGARFIYAEARVRESATAAAVFYFAQAALTKNLGVEATVPTQYVSLDDVDAESVYTNGNPLLAVKYRFHLPAWGGNRPALTARARVGFPFSPPSKLRPSDFFAEDLTQQVYFVDTYAFLADFWDTGVGASWAWDLGPLSFDAQLYFDYFLPLDDEETGLFAVAYGGAVGYAPVPWISGWAEARATSLLTGFSRSEAVAYFGLRGRFWRVFEPAAFVGIPVGSIAETSSVQIGAELRLSHDVLAGSESDRGAPRPIDAGGRR